MKSKKILVFIFLLVSIVLTLNFRNNVNAYHNNKYKFTLEDTITLDTVNGIYICSNLYISYHDSNINIYSLTGNLTINDKYVCHYYDNNNLYICSSDTLYIVNLKLLSYKEIFLEFNLNNLYVDEYIYLVGDIHNNPCIYLMNNQGDMIKSKIYEGSGFATFKTIDQVNDDFVITGEKDAFFDNPDFLKVGNINERKSFVFVFDKTLKKLNDYYFNEYTEYEVISQVVIDSNINIILSTSSYDVYYQFNKDLTLSNYLKFDSINKYLYVQNILNEMLFIKEDISSFEIGFFQENSFTPIFSLNYRLNNFDITNGLLVLNYNNSLNLYSEYHIDRCDTLVLTKIKYEYDSTSHFEVNSFFETLTFKLDKYTPFHIHMISGEYNASYISKNMFGSNVFLQTKVIVKDFVNIIDGGIYNKGLMLQFFGNASLNGESIHNGHTIEEVGEYELTIKNVNQITKTYKFKVVDNYYKDNDHYVIDVDYLLDKQEEVVLKFELSSNKTVRYFIVNNNHYNNFYQEDNFVYLKINALSDYGYQNIYINSIITDEEITINKDLTILTRKSLPALDISSSNNDIYQINVKYEDVDNTFVDIYFKEYSSNEIKSTSLKNTSNIASSGKLILCYELGDGIILEETLFVLEGQDIKYDVEFYDDEIIIKVYPKESLKKILINDNNIYHSTSDNTNLYICIITVISSLLVVVITILVLLIKRKRRKVNRI